MEANISNNRSIVKKYQEIVLKCNKGKKERVIKWENLKKKTLKISNKEINIDYIIENKDLYIFDIDEKQMKVLPANNEVLLREFQNKNIETCYIYELLEDKQVTCVHFGVTKDFNRELYVINID